MCVYPSSSLTAVDAANMAIHVLTPGGFLRGNIPAFRVWHSSTSLLCFSWVKALWCFYCIKLVSPHPHPKRFLLRCIVRESKGKRSCNIFYCCCQFVGGLAYKPCSLALHLCGAVLPYLQAYVSWIFGCEDKLARL